MRKKIFNKNKQSNEIILWIYNLVRQIFKNDLQEQQKKIRKKIYHLHGKQNSYNLAINIFLIH